MTGVGPTEEMSLRASVATLARLLIPHPGSGETLLALEHKATAQIRDGEPSAHLQAQPFGGAVRIPSPTALQEKLGQFHFDSARSKAEKDFRIFIEPSQWPALKKLVIDELNQGRSPIIDPDPRRELEEEFQDALDYSLRPEQFSAERGRVVVEDEPVPTGSWRAHGRMTARIYCIYQVELLDQALPNLLLNASQQHPGAALLHLAKQRAQQDGHFGRANGILLAPLEEIEMFFRRLDSDTFGESLSYQDTTLSDNVAAVLDEIPCPKYRLLRN